MRFWDSSAIVTMLAAQRGSEAMLELLRKDSDMAVWWGTILECRVAINHLHREFFLNRNWLEITPTQQLRNTAIDLSLSVGLKAADILQLAAATVWRGEETPNAEFVCLDRRLRNAATTRGFAALPVAA